MNKSRLLGAEYTWLRAIQSLVSILAFSLTLMLIPFSLAAAPLSLQNGDVLMFTSAEGSFVSGIALCNLDSAPVDALNGLIIGTSQPTFPDIDQTWTSSSFGTIGNHFTTSAVNVINETTLDFSGWAFHQMLGNIGGVHAIGEKQGLATYSYDVTNFTLDYSWSGAAFGPLFVTQYDLYLVGTVSSIPVPTAVWLFSSGLLGLIGIARRKRG